VSVIIGSAASKLAGGDAFAGGTAALYGENITMRFMQLGRV